MKTAWIFFLGIMACIAAYNDAYLACGFITCGILLGCAD